MSSERMRKQMKARLVDQLHDEKQFREALDKALDRMCEEHLRIIARDIEAEAMGFMRLRMPGEHQAPPA